MIKELPHSKRIMGLIGGEKCSKTLGKDEGIVIDQNVPVVIQISMFEKINEFEGKFFVGIACSPGKKTSIWIHGMP